MMKMMMTMMMTMKMKMTWRMTRAVEELKKTHKNLLESERKIDQVQKTTDQEIQQFQTDKQRKLNQVEIVFALRLSQVQCLDGGTQGVGDADATPGNEKLPAELD